LFQPGVLSESAFVLGSDEARFVLELNYKQRMSALPTHRFSETEKCRHQSYHTRPFRRRRHARRALDLDVEKIQTDASLAHPTALATIQTVRHGFVAFQVSFPARQTASTDSLRLGSGRCRPCKGQLLPRSTMAAAIEDSIARDPRWLFRGRWEVNQGSWSRWLRCGLPTKNRKALSSDILAGWRDTRAR
jgi:hypothetical protein